MKLWPVLAGVLLELAVVVTGLVVPLPGPWGVRVGLTVGVLDVGLASGLLTGIIRGGSWRQNTAAGFGTGLVGGTAVAVAVYATVTNLHPIARRTAFWTVHYAIARSLGLPSWLVVRYGYVVVATISIALGAFVLLESTVAAAAVASTGPTPRSNDERMRR